MKTGIELIAAERERQIKAEGWTPAHDDQYTKAELERAALCYLDVAASQAVVGGKGETYGPPDEWPWDLSWWKPADDPQRNLEKAGALVAAALDKHQRANAELAAVKGADEEPMGWCKACGAKARFCVCDENAQAMASADNKNPPKETTL